MRFFSNSADGLEPEREHAHTRRELTHVEKEPTHIGRKPVQVGMESAHVEKGGIPKVQTLDSYVRIALVRSRSQLMGFGRPQNRALIFSPHERPFQLNHAPRPIIITLLRGPTRPGCFGFSLPWHACSWKFFYKILFTNILYMPSLYNIWAPKESVISYSWIHWVFLTCSYTWPDPSGLTGPYPTTHTPIKQLVLRSSNGRVVLEMVP